MDYVSTRGEAPVLGFEEVMLTGLAADGGLYVPAAVPRLGPETWAGIAEMDYEGAAYEVMAPFVGEAFAEAEFRELIAAAYGGFGHPARAPLRELDRGLWLAELFHGPTLAFKDFAMQLIGRMMDHVLTRRGRRATIVGATSGDTGSAAIEAFRGMAAVDVVILFPEGRVSEVQRRQMTTPAEDNVHAVAVAGTFDDCQRQLKAMFADAAFRDEVGLAAVNSINWARVMAQVVYYATAATALGAPARQVDFAVPTGNFGDVYAGHVARAMGLPIRTLAVATNHNDILARAFAEGEYRVGEVRPSISPSMDIQVSSNFERLLFDAYARDGAAVARLMHQLRDEGGFRIDQGAREAIGEGFAAAAVDEAATSARIRATRDETGELVCPHTAVGLEVARAHREPAVPMVALATAHPAKFPDAVEAATGVRPPLPNRMADLYDRPERVHRAPDDLARLQDLIRDLRQR